MLLEPGTARRYNIDEFLSQTATIVVNWNQADETFACVRSLLAAGALPETVYIVDNGSTDDSVTQFRSQTQNYPVQLLTSQTNLGFAGGTNIGIQQALANGAQWVLTVNNDTRVAPSFYQELAFAVRSHPQYKLLTPAIFYYDDPERIWSLGDRLFPGTLITYGLFRNRSLPTDIAPIVPIDFANACGLLVHRDVFQTIGCFNTEFFMYGEDVEFCWRARKADFRIAAVPKARMFHKVSLSSETCHTQRRRWRIINQIRFYRKASTWFQYPIMILFTFLRALWISSGDVMHGRFKLAYATVHSWWLGWFTPYHGAKTT